MTASSAGREAAGAHRVLIVVNDLLVYRTAATQPTGIQRLADDYGFRVATAILTVDGN